MRQNVKNPAVRRALQNSNNCIATIKDSVSMAVHEERKAQKGESIVTIISRKVRLYSRKRGPNKKRVY